MRNIGHRNENCHVIKKGPKFVPPAHYINVTFWILKPKYIYRVCATCCLIDKYNDKWDESAILLTIVNFEQVSGSELPGIMSHNILLADTSFEKRNNLRFSVSEGSFISGFAFMPGRLKRNIAAEVTWSWGINKIKINKQTQWTGHWNALNSYNCPFTLKF